MPGRKEQRGEAKTEAEIDLNKEVFESFICFKLGASCLGRTCFFEIEVIREEIPNKPVNRGRRGSFRGRFIFIKPRIPDKRKIIMAQKREDFSK